MDAQLEVKELIRYITATFFDKKKYHISRTSLIKILYKTKKYTDDHPINKFLQFYWYEQGPYSPLLITLKDQMVSEGILHETNNGLVAEKSRIIDHDEFFEQLRNHVNQIINDAASNNSLTLIDDIYESDAPYRFYLSFKSRFLASLDNIIRDPNTHIKPDHLITILRETIGDLPNDVLFSKFKYNYLDFVELLSAIVESKKIIEFGSRLKNDSEEIFKVFARGVRILHHDPYYENDVDNWKEIFNNAINNMETNILSLYSEAKNTPIKNIRLSTLDDLIQEILSLKAKKKLVAVSFFPPIRDESINYGSLDASIFNKLSESDFKELLQKFHNSKNAIIDEADEDDLNVIKYRITAS